MTGAERLCYRRRSLLWGLALLLGLGGAVGVSWLLIDRDRIADQRDRAATQFAREADLRGRAVSTLARDVRELRSQLQAAGKKPSAPDPAKAVEDLPDRAEVPVPIPGPRGPAGEPGKSGASGRPGQDGEDGRTGAAGRDGADGVGETGSPGVPGEPGADGAVGPPGPPGEPGARGEKGEQGEPGRDGQNCPEGYSLRPPADDPDALVCRRDGAPAPDPDDDPPPQAAALDPQRRQY